MKIKPIKEVEDRLKKLNVSVNKEKRKKDKFVFFYDKETDCFYITTAMCILSDNIKACFHRLVGERDLIFVNQNSLMDSRDIDLFGLDDFKEKYPNCCLDLFDKCINENQISRKSNYHYIQYLMLYRKYPYLEQLMKAGFDHIILSGIRDNGSTEHDFRKIFKNGKNIKDITELDNACWQYLLSISGDMYLWSIYKNIIKKHNVSVEQLKKFNKLMWKEDILATAYYLKEILELEIDGNNLYTISSITNYLINQKQKHNIQPSRCLNLLVDYIKMCNDLDIEPYTKPENIKKVHDDLIPLYDDYELKIREKTYEEYVKGFNEQKKRLEKYLYEDNDLKVMIPDSPSDLIKEGQTQHNCVATYTKGHASQETNIFFIRKKDNLDESYITVEFDDINKSIIQARYKYNKSVNEKSDKAFIDKWLKYCRV